jgi:hypothetical protein
MEQGYTSFDYYGLTALRVNGKFHETLCTYTCYTGVSYYQMFIMSVGTHINLDESMDGKYFENIILLLNGPEEENILYHLYF